MQEADDTQTLFAGLRTAKAQVSRRRPRSLIRRDAEPASLASLPESIALSRGRLEVSFASVEQLAEALYAIARLLEDDGEIERFAEFYEPEPLPLEPEGRDEVKALFVELEAMERTRQS